MCCRTQLTGQGPPALSGQSVAPSVVCLLVTPKAEGSLECPVAQLAHKLSFKCDC